MCASLPFLQQALHKVLVTIHLVQQHSGLCAPCLWVYAICCALVCVPCLWSFLQHAWQKQVASRLLLYWYDTGLCAPCLSVSCSRHYINWWMTNHRSDWAMHYTLCQSFSGVNAGMQRVPEPSNKDGTTASKHVVWNNVLTKQGCKGRKREASTTELKYCFLPVTQPAWPPSRHVLQ